MPAKLRGRATVRLLAALSSLVFCVLLASTPSGGQAAGQASAGGGETAWEKYLVPDAPEPTFRLPVAHSHRLSFCLGYMFITRREIRFVVKTPLKNRDHGFASPRSSITDAHEWTLMGTSTGWAEFKFADGKTVHFNLIRESLVDEPQTQVGWKDVGSVLLWQRLVEAATRFDDVLAQAQRNLAPKVEPQPPTRQEPTEPPASAGPKVNVLEPPVADASKPVEVTEPTLTLRGTATDARGVATVAVNGQPAELRSVGGITTMEFSARNLPLQEGANQLTVVATNVDKQSTQMVFMVWLRSKVVAPVSATATPAQKPLTEVKIVDLLRSGVTSRRVIMLVEERGIDFDLTNDYIEVLRTAGAEDSLIEALRKAKRVKPSSSQPPPATQ
jgi:hypothetical protein